MDKSKIETSTDLGSPNFKWHWVRRTLLVVCLVLLAGLLPIRWSLIGFDRAVANLATFAVGFLAGLFGLIWFVTWSWKSWLFRLAVLVAPVLVGLLFGVLYRFEGFSGELIPIFRGRWIKVSAAPAIELGAKKVPIPDSPLAGQYDFSKIHFPQFLGPNRNGVILNLTLDPDWETHPPEILWKQAIGAGWSGFAIEGRRAVTLEQRDKQEWITCYDLLTGTPLWRFPYRASHYSPAGGAGPRSTPTISGGYVYTYGATGVVNCVSLEDGAHRWKKTFISGHDDWPSQTVAEEMVTWGRSGSPLVLGERVYIPIGGLKDHSGKSLAMLDAKIGEVIWRQGSDQISYASPVSMSLAGVEQIVMVNESTVSGFQADTGIPLWSFPWEGQSNGSASVSQPVQVEDNQLLLTKGYGQGAALIQISSADDGKQKAELKWKDHTFLKTKFTTTVLHNGCAYGLSDGILECVDLAGRKRKWKKGRFGQGQLLLVGDLLLVSSEDGNVVLVQASPSDFNEVARLHILEGVTWNMPALAGPFLMVRNANEAACVRLPLLSN